MLACMKPELWTRGTVMSLTCLSSASSPSATASSDDRKRAAGSAVCELGVLGYGESQAERLMVGLTSLMSGSNESKTALSEGMYLSYTQSVELLQAGSRLRELTS